MDLGADQANRIDIGRWAVAVTYVDGSTQDYRFASEQQAEQALKLILDADPGSIVKLSEHVFIQRDQVSTAAVTHDNDESVPD
ncbi:MAG: hypothetical protein ACOC9Y_09835 [Chloroflexota bacterium]